MARRSGARPDDSVAGQSRYRGDPTEGRHDNSCLDMVKLHGSPACRTPTFHRAALALRAASYRGRAQALRFLTVASGATFAVHWLSACGMDHKPGDPYPTAIAPAARVWVATHCRWHCSAWIRILMLGLDVMRLQGGTLAALGRAAYSRFWLLSISAGGTLMLALGLRAYSHKGPRFAPPAECALFPAFNRS